jgi:hypothetical protein
MPQRHRIAWLAIPLLVLLGASGVPRAAQAGMGEAALALAGPLAEQFGVPASAVTGLLEGGLSIDSVTQLLLVSQSSGSKLDAVTSLFRESGNDIDATAKQLEVEPAAYSPTRVSSAIDQAKSSAQASATDKATKGASDAVGSALEGWKR